MPGEVNPAGKPLHTCHACGAELEVRVRFRGLVVWKVDRDDAGFGGGEPELRGDYGEPRLLCSADVLHRNGFKLIDGEVIPTGQSER